MSPRRSSRARQTQPLRPNPSQSGSSSSTSSNRNHRNSRTHTRHDSQMKSATPRSSSDEPDRPQPLEIEARQTRQKKREQDTHDSINGEDIYEDVPDEEGDDGEVTRCICGQQEYPGPPEHIIGRTCINQRVQDNLSKTNPDVHPHPLLFEMGSLFIQCETCHVWQHGGCVGIMDEAMSPEHYYCEECKEALHKIYVEPTSGRKYSKFTKAYQDWECTQPSVTSKKSIYYDTQTVYHLLANSERVTPSVISNAKRRSTMNSRAAADEEEALLKAIEESKTDGRTAGTSSAARRAKRGREDSSEETVQELKRRKTGSESGSPSVFPTESAAAGSDTESQQAKHRSGTLTKKGRGPAGQLMREAATRDRERDRDRVEAAPRRRGKLEKRWGDEIEVPDETNRNQDIARNLSATSRPAGTAASSKQHLNLVAQAAPSASRRGVKTGGRRGRAGRNQYTKDREAGTESKHDSPRASHSRDSEDIGNSDGHGPNTLINGSKPSKPRHMNPNRTSMNDLRKRAAGILEYITRTQVEISETATPSKPKDSRTRSISTENGNAAHSLSLDGPEDTKPERLAEEAEEGDGVDESVFREFTSLQMMDVLTRELVMWQKVYGKFGER